MDSQQLREFNEHGQDIKLLKHRVGVLEENTKAIQEMSTNMSVMVRELTDIKEDNQELKMDIKREITEVKTDINGVKKDVSDMKLRPANDYKKMAFEIIKWGVIFALSYMAGSVWG